jgi:hypothetical protein
MTGWVLVLISLFYPGDAGIAAALGVYDDQFNCQQRQSSFMETKIGPTGLDYRGRYEYHTYCVPMDSRFTEYNFNVVIPNGRRPWGTSSPGVCR